MELKWNYGTTPTKSDTYMVSYICVGLPFTYCLYWSARKQKWFRTATESEEIKDSQIYAWAEMPEAAPLWIG